MQYLEHKTEFVADYLSFAIFLLAITIIFFTHLTHMLIYYSFTIYLFSKCILRYVFIVINFIKIIIDNLIARC